ncbi:unnamed protein product [Arctogadus glacialis]
MWQFSGVDLDPQQPWRLRPLPVRTKGTSSLPGGGGLQVDGVYLSKWGCFQLQDGMLYQRLQDPSLWCDLMQLLVSFVLRRQVPQIVHGSAGPRYYRNAKTLHCLRGRFYWPGCRQNVMLPCRCPSWGALVACLSATAP